MMMTLTEHNESMVEQRTESNRLGVVCDKCGQELYKARPGIVLASLPPRVETTCRNCGEHGYMVV